MAERLALERRTTRIYEALLAKLATISSTATPAREQIRWFRNEEAAHFEILCEAIESLGGDPLAPLPRGDAIDAQARLLSRVIEDPQTPLARCVELLLDIVAADLAGWDELLALARADGHDALEQRFLLIRHEVAEQVHCLRQWSTALTTKSVQAAA